MFDIGVYAYLRALFFWKFRRVWAGKRRLRKRLLGRLLAEQIEMLAYITWLMGIRA